MDGTRRNSTAFEGLHMNDDLRAFSGIGRALLLSIPVLWRLRHNTGLSPTTKDSACHGIDRLPCGICQRQT